MLGFRVYPLAITLQIWRTQHVGRRMDFDTEIMVRLFWADVDVLSLPTRVTYPSDGVSHFDVWRDNLRISGMHARLFDGLLWRAPRLIGRRMFRCRGRHLYAHHMSGSEQRRGGKECVRMCRSRLGPSH